MVSKYSSLHEALLANGFNSMQEVTKEAQSQVKLFRNGTIKPILTFSTKINQNVMFLPGDQIVIGGRPGVGKSAFSLQLVKSMIERHHGNAMVLFWSWEMRSWRQVLRLFSAELHISATDLLKPEVNFNEQKIEAAVEKLKDLPIYFRTAPASHKKWAEIVGNVAKAHNGLLINLIDHTRLGKSEGNQSEEQKITAFMEEGMYLKNQYGCVNLFLSQLNRNAETNARSRHDLGKTPPVLSDFFGADSVAQFADHAIILHRPELYGVPQFEGIDTRNLFLVYVLKQRDGFVGKILMEHNLAHNQFFDL